MTSNIDLKAYAQAYCSYIKNNYIQDVRSAPFLGFNSWNDRSDLLPIQVAKEKAQVIFAAMTSLFAAYIAITTRPVATLVVLTTSVVVHSLQFFNTSKTFALIGKKESLVSVGSTPTTTSTSTTTSSTRRVTGDGSDSE